MIIRYEKFDKYGYEIKGYDYFNKRFLRSISIPVARILKKTSVAPEVIAFFSLLLAIFASFLYSKGNKVSVLYGTLVFFISWIFDNVDGDLARLTSRTSYLGEWTDSLIGKIVTVIIYMGICSGLAKNDAPHIWFLGFFILSGFYISGIINYKTILLKLKMGSSIPNPDNQPLQKERTLLMAILHELSVGHNFMYYLLIVGGLINTLYLVIIISAIYIWLFTAVTVFSSYWETKHLFYIKQIKDENVF